MYGCKNKGDSTLKLHARVFPLMMSKNASNKVKCILSEGFQTLLLTFKIKVLHFFSVVVWALPYPPVCHSPVFKLQVYYLSNS